MKSSDLSFYIETLGCPKNIVDSRTMRSTLLQNGFSAAPEPEQANILIINTCSFIKEAQENTIETIFSALNLKSVAEKKQKGKFRKIGIVGCFVQQFTGELEKEIPEIDFFLGTGKFHEIAGFLGEKFSITISPVLPGDIKFPRGMDSSAPHAYFRIAQGCSRQCSFCIIPSIRGNLIQYNLQDIQRQYNQEMSLRSESSPLREAIFVSQDTVSTGIDDLRQFAEFFQNRDHIEWIRLHYLFPDKRVFDILKLMGEYSKIVPYLDIPFQHASPAILKAMKRPDDVGIFHEIINRAMQMNPDMEIRTAFIVGFPGETDDDVEHIARFLQTMPVHKCAFFRYSHESGTGSYNIYKDDVPDHIKIERINYLRDIHLKARAELRASWIGRKTYLMLDEINQKEIIARRPQDSPDIDEVVYLQHDPDRKYRPGDIVQAILQTAMEYDWIGEIQ